MTLGDGQLGAKVDCASRDCLASGAGSFWDSMTGIRAGYLSIIEGNSDVLVQPGNVRADETFARSAFHQLKEEL